MYYLIYGVLYLFSLLPIRALYVLSDLAYVVVYYIIGYRRKIVMQNLSSAFPEKPDDELNRISRSFYRNMTDNLIEMIKLISASDRFMNKHMVIENAEFFDEMLSTGRKCHLHLGHTFNWEYANRVTPHITRYPFLVAYMPLSNPAFERLLYKVRTKSGTKLLPATDMSRAIIPYRDRPYLLTLVADQAPGNPEGSYWLNFFGRPTPFLRAPERGARIANIPIVYAHFYKNGRGRYHAIPSILEDQPAQQPEGAITKKFVKMLEDSIRKEPALYLWSHRRWKHEWKPEYQKMWIGDKADLPSVKTTIEQ
jgi:KDO2-lipid IV(A) lauroyltransferase